MRHITQSLWLAVGLWACGDQADIDAYLETPRTQAEIDAQLGDLLAEAESALPKADLDAAEAYVADPPTSNHPVGTVVHDPETEAEAWHTLGVLAFMEGRATLAQWLFVRAAQQQPGDALALQQVAFVLAHQDRDDEARPLLVTAADADDELHSPEVELALLYERSGELDKALYQWMRAKAVSPYHTEIKRSLARVWHALGQTEAAHFELQAALMLAPDDPVLQADLDALPGGGPGLPFRRAPGTPKPPPDAQMEVERIILDKRREVDEILDEQLALISEAQEERGTVRQIEQILNLDTSLACSSACSDDDCRDNCAEQFCLDETSSHNKFRADVRGYPGDIDGAYAAWTAGMGAIVFPTLDAHRRKLTKEQFDEVRQDFLLEAAGAQGWVQLSYAGTAGAIAIDAEQVKLACQPVDDIQAPDASAPLAEPDPDDIDLCLDNVLCFGINNDEITLSAFAGPVSFEVSVDTKTGDFAMEATLGFNVLGDTAKAGAGLRFHSRKGLGAVAEFKVGGIVSVKANKEFYFVHFNLSDD